MSVRSPAVRELKQGHPEWAPWLTLVDQVLRESASGNWNSVVPTPVQTAPAIPVLSGTTVIVPERLFRSMIERLAAAAVRGGPPKMVRLTKLLAGDPGLAELFHASVTQDVGRMNEIASSRTVDAEALHAVVSLLALPFLQACHTHWDVPGGTSWAQGYCAICGAWPAFAEVRGVERRRFNRCGRCGSAWYARVLQCTYCRTTDHDQMVALVPEKEQGRGAIDACRRCGGYMKVFTRLQGGEPSAVMLDDLGSADLDVAALNAGFTRPLGAGYPTAVSVHMSVGRRFLAWNG